MADFTLPVWNDTRIQMLDFARAPLRPPRTHPHRACPDIDRYGYMDDAFANEHGPIVSCSVGQRRVNVAVVRTEISTTARLYAVPANGAATIRLLDPHNGRLPDKREATIAFRPVATGRTSIDIRYWWPDGPIVARLYVDVRALRTINCRFHLVDVNGAGWGNQFLGQVRPPGMALAAHHTSRIAQIVEGVNHVFLPHGIAIVNSETVATAWHNGLFTAAGDAAYWQIMHAMAHSPHRGPNRLNVFIADWPHARASANPPPFDLDFVALGPPIAWATNISARWPNAPGGHVGSGIMVDANAIPFTGSILAHEFGHIFHLSVLTAAGAVRQWHTIGDNTASRDDMVTRRRLMYPYTSLANSNNSWRNDVGYGSDMGALLVQRRLGQDETYEESRRAYDHATAAHVYAP